MFLVFLVVSVIHLWPIVRLISTHSTPNTDTPISLWWVSQMSRQMISNPLRLFDGNIFYPHPYTLAVVDHMLITSLAAIPLWLATRNPILVHNVALVATFVLSGFFTALLVRRLSGSWWAGLVAGTAFAFSAFRWYELPHLHILSTQWIPLALLAMDLVVERASRRRIAGFAAAAVAVALSSWHATIVGGMLLALVAVLSLVQQRGSVKRQMIVMAGVTLLAGLIVAPMVVPYTYMARWQLNRTEGQRDRGLARLALSVNELLPSGIFIGPPPEDANGNARLTWTFAGLATWGLAACAFVPRRGAGRPPISRRLLAAGVVAGAIVAALAAAVLGGVAGSTALSAILVPAAPVVVLAAVLLLFALLAARRQALDESPAEVVRIRRARLIYTTVVVGGLLLAMGPRVTAWGISLGEGLYQPRYFPPFNVIRAPERFGLWFALGLAILAGLGTARILSLVPRVPVFLMAVALFVVLNMDIRPAPIAMGQEDIPGPGHYWLQASREPGPLLEVPSNRWKLAMLGAFLHDKRLVNGVGFVYPPYFTDMWEMSDIGTARLEHLWEHSHPKLVMVRGRYYNREERARILAELAARPDALTKIAEAGEDVIYRLRDRGRGPELRRRWPRAALADARGVAFSASVGDARDGRVNRLTLSLNDHTMLELEGTATADAIERRLPLNDDWFVPYDNRFDLRGDYRYLPGQPSHAIGQTGMKVAADLHARADTRLAWYQVNGDKRDVSPGYTLVTIDPATGAVGSRATFNTARATAESGALARFVAALPDATPVLVVSEGAAASRLTDEAVAALRSLGLATDPRPRRAVQCAIGVKGAREGSVPEGVHRRATDLTLGTPEFRDVQLDGFDLY